MALDRSALAAAKMAAARQGLSLSGLLMKLLRAHFEREERFASMGRFLDSYALEARVRDNEVQAIRDEMRAPLKPIRRRRRKTAA